MVGGGCGGWLDGVRILKCVCKFISSVSGLYFLKICLKPHSQRDGVEETVPVSEH